MELAGEEAGGWVIAPVGDDSAGVGGFVVGDGGAGAEGEYASGVVVGIHGGAVGMEDSSLSGWELDISLKSRLLSKYRMLGRSSERFGLKYIDIRSTIDRNNSAVVLIPLGFAAIPNGVSTTTSSLMFLIRIVISSLLSTVHAIK